MILPVIAVPWIIGGLSAAAGALGIKKGVDAKKITNVHAILLLKHNPTLRTLKAGWKRPKRKQASLLPILVN